MKTEGAYVTSYWECTVRRSRAAAEYVFWNPNTLNAIVVAPLASCSTLYFVPLYWSAAAYTAGLLCIAAAAAICLSLLARALYRLWPVAELTDYKAFVQRCLRPVVSAYPSSRTAGYWLFPAVTTAALTVLITGLALSGAFAASAASVPMWGCVVLSAVGASLTFNIVCGLNKLLANFQEYWSNHAWESAHRVDELAQESGDAIIDERLEGAVDSLTKDYPVHYDQPPTSNALGESGEVLGLPSAGGLRRFWVSTITLRSAGQRLKEVLEADAPSLDPVKKDLLTMLHALGTGRTQCG